MPDYTVSGDVDSMLRSANDAAIRSAIGVGMTDAPTFLAQTLTGQSLTGTQATSLVDLNATWNTTGNPSLIYGRVTNTNSGTTANLIDLGTFAGGSLFSVSKAGALTTSFSITSSYVQAGSNFVLTSDAGAIVFGASPDLWLRRDAAGILAQRNGVNAQALRVANSVGASPLVDYDRGVFDFKTTTNTLRIGTENGGTYTTARPIEFVTGGVVRMAIAANGDIALTSGTSFGGSSSVSVIGAGHFRFSGRAAIYSTADGNITLFNNLSTGFNLLTLGGTTSAFPAIKRNGTGIDIRLADDSGPAPLTAGLITASGGFSATGLGFGSLANGFFYWASSTAMSAPSNGVLKITNAAGNSFTRLELGATNLGISCGTGTPEGVVTALIGSLYIRTDGGASTTLYVKESGTGNTGWVAK